MSRINTAGRTISPKLKSAARAGGKGLIWLLVNDQFFAFIITLGIMLVAPHVVHAQTSGGPIQVWDRSDTDLQRGVLNIVRLVKWLMIAGGLIAICYGITKMWTRKPFVLELVGGAISLSAGVIIAFSDSLFKRDVDTPDFLGR
jgi:hypothetical protein